MSNKKPTTLEQLRFLAVKTQGELSKRDERISDIIDVGAEPNILNGVNVNGVALTIANKIVDILIASGTANGTLKVNGIDVAVKGLAALAYKAEVSEAELASALKTTINNKAAQSDVNTLQTAINTLNGTGTGSVKKAVDDAINEFASKVSDDGTINTLKELVDWVSEHGNSAVAMAGGISKNATDIKDLATLIGTLPTGATSSTIVAYIAEAIADLNIGDYAKTSAMNTAIAAAIASYYSKNEVNTLLAGYVTKSGNKVLSTNDYTTADKNKLSGIATGATKVESSASNGSIKINGVETVVYTEPSDTMHGDWATDAEVYSMLTSVFGS